VLNRAREVYHSEAIGHYCDEFGIPDPRRPLERKRLAEQQALLQRADRGLRSVAEWSWWFPGYWLWLFTLAAFIAADVVAVACT
jgi:hypothetical protein